MNELPRQRLRELIARHGPSVVEDARRVEGLLKDYSGGFRREVSVLVSALEEGVARELLDAPAGTPREVLLTRAARRLVDNLALNEEAARWSVNSWAFALGLVSDAELKDLEGRGAAQADDERDEERSAASAPRAAAGVGASVIVSAGGGGDYASITAALNSVGPGARVLVRPGLYEESVLLDKEVELVGDGPRERIVVTGGEASCLHMRADSARVAGLTLRGEARGGAAFFAVDIPRGRLLLEDCDITSDTLSCVAAYGPEAAPALRRCRVRDGADSGLYFFDRATGTVEDCEVYGHANVCVAVTGGAAPSVSRSKIYGGASAGVVVWEGGAGLFEGCEIYGNRLAGLGVSEGGNPTLRACRIHEGDNSGVLVHRGGEAVLEDCELYGHREPEAAVTTRGKLFLRACRVHHGRDTGVFVRDGGQALLQACVVHANAGAGASVGAGSVLAVLASQLTGNAGFGVEVAEGATARVEDSDLTGNRLGAWAAERGANVEAERNHE